MRPSPTARQEGGIVNRMVTFSDHSPVTFQDPLPDAVDVVIIGAGVIGTSTAWFLNQRGVSVLVCDKGRVAGEQSSRNWGWIRQQGRDAAELPIVIESINAWESLSKELDEDIGFTRQGVLYCSDRTATRDEERQHHVRKQHELPQRENRQLFRHRRCGGTLFHCSVFVAAREQLEKAVADLGNRQQRFSQQQQAKHQAQLVLIEGFEVAPLRTKQVGSLARISVGEHRGDTGCTRERADFEESVADLRARVGSNGELHEHEIRRVEGVC